MKRLRHGELPRGFTLVELLVVIAIIGILAALLLPVLNQAKSRAKCIACVSQLREIGQAAQVFANDHHGRLPMQVSVRDGGSEELTHTTGNFTFRHFQSLSNELATPGMVLCPADTLLPAQHFATLQNTNVSYFVNIRAEQGKSTSILAGDRNLTSDRLGDLMVLPLGVNSPLRWTHELHRFKGNIVFNDGHVESFTGPTLKITTGDSVAEAQLSMPPGPPTAMSAGFDSGKAPVPILPEHSEFAVTLPDPPKSPQSGTVDSRSASHAALQPTLQADSLPADSQNATAAQIAANAPSGGAGRATDDLAMLGQFDSQVVSFLQGLIKWTYLLFLLLLLLYLACRFYCWEARRSRRRLASTDYDLGQ